MVIATDFASAERDAIGVIEQQHATLGALPFVQEFLNAMPHMTVVLNAHRQIVFGNRVFAQFLGFTTEHALPDEAETAAVQRFIGQVTGLRPGEAVGCVHAGDHEGGCGTSLACRRCGLVRAILDSQATGQQQIHDGVLERRATNGKSGETLDLRVWARPVEVADEPYTVFSIVDISPERRRDALERIFFHDVLNTASGLRGLAEVMTEGAVLPPAVHETAAMLLESADMLIEEINGQRTLHAAESGELSVNVEVIRAQKLLEQVQHQFAASPVALGKELALDPLAVDFAFTSDQMLVRRVLTNLVKNAFEASPDGATVTLSSGTGPDAKHLWFSVNNVGVMPQDVQSHVFTRSYSTKGAGRGLGTYSIKLITETFLRGEAGFESTAGGGTTFTVRLPRFLF